ncbi:MAG: outer membrane protein assembly factor [Gammaproteobacteria bacterium]|nr:MAG: outer membrane protein assembly factor [Gammaproteobacteria bacterium]
MRGAVCAACGALLATLATAGTVPQLEIHGAPEALAANLRAHLALDTLPCALDDETLAARLARRLDRIAAAARALGYYALRYRHRLRREADCWTLELDVEPGPRLTIGEVSIVFQGDAARDPAFAELRATSAPRVGEPLDHGRYEAFKDAVETLALERGYFDGRWLEHRLEVDPPAGRARIRLVFDGGRRHRFGALHIEPGPLSESLLARYAPWRPNDFYRHDRLLAYQQALLDADYFAEVELRPRPEDRRDGAVPIELRTTPLPRHVWSLGVGAATDTGPRLSLEHLDRYRNPAGHRFGQSLSLSPLRSELRLDYRIPLARPATEQLALQSAYREESDQTVDARAMRLGAVYSRLLPRRWLQHWGLSLERERYAVADTRRDSRLLLPSLGLSKTEADDPLYPRHGWRAALELRGSSTRLGSDIDFLQAVVRLKQVLGLGPGRLSWRLDLGRSRVDALDTLPASLRFFAGGDQSVRGYRYRTLGPVDERGEVTGGSHLAVAGLEYDWRFAGDWAAALFVDAGNAYSDAQPLDPKRGAGFGLRWITPVGPIRIDLAKALDDGGRWRLHLSMGPDL